MSAGFSSRSQRLVVVSATWAMTALIWACSLNPQPIPPGEQPDGSFPAAPGAGDSNGGEGSNKGADDASTGTANDATDASPDADARDAAPDGPTDAGDGGG